MQTLTVSRAEEWSVPSCVLELQLAYGVHLNVAVEYRQISTLTVAGYVVVDISNDVHRREYNNLPRFEIPLIHERVVSIEAQIKAALIVWEHFLDEHMRK